MRSNVHHSNCIVTGGVRSVISSNLPFFLLHRAPFPGATENRFDVKSVRSIKKSATSLLMSPISIPIGGVYGTKPKNGGIVATFPINVRWPNPQ